MVQRTIVHIFDAEYQDSVAVTAILKHVLQEVKEYGIDEAVIRSDNADIGDGHIFEYDQLRSYENKAEIQTSEFWQYIFLDDTESIISLPSERRRYWYENKELRYWMAYKKQTVQVKSSCHSSLLEDEIPQEAPQFYTCPEEICTKSFETQVELEEHIDSGNHHYVPHRVTLRDKVLDTYSRKLEGFNELKTMPFIAEAVTTYLYEHPIENPSEGFAHYKRKTCKRFSQTTIEFLKELFESGKISNKKINPRSTAEAMRKALTADGNIRFMPDELLNENQIKSYFSRLAAIERQNSDSAPIKSRKRKVIETFPESEICEEDEMILFDDEPIIENDASFYMDSIQSELSKETRVCNEPRQPYNPISQILFKTSITRRIVHNVLQF
uniref:C2H2-type domain-containing protein n=1 Tax=Acrobeloides nanus TaxID=290746 RepID=A0A914CY67_9BILA